MANNHDIVRACDDCKIRIKLEKTTNLARSTLHRDRALMHKGFHQQQDLEECKSHLRIALANDTHLSGSSLKRMQKKAWEAGVVVQEAWQEDSDWESDTRTHRQNTESRPRRGHQREGSGQTMEAPEQELGSCRWGDSRTGRRQTQSLATLVCRLLEARILAGAGKRQKSRHLQVKLNQQQKI